MKSTKPHSTRAHVGGFTLIEIMIVVVIIGIIAGFGVPAGIEALRRGRVASVLGAVNKLSTATTAYMTRAGGAGVLPLTEGTIPAAQFSGTGATAVNVAAATSIDQVWLTEGMLDAPLAVKMGSQVYTVTGTAPTWTPSSNSFVATVAPTANRATVTRAETQVSNPALAPSAANGSNFRLNGTTDLLSNLRVEALILVGVPADDALQLSLTIDGATNSQPTNATADDAGKVAYPAPTSGTTNVSVFIAYY